MSPHPFGARATLRALRGLDFGLRVRVETRLVQRSLFATAENASAQELTSELSEMQMTRSGRQWGWEVGGGWPPGGSATAYYVDCRND
jgi:hypothetical protein